MKRLLLVLALFPSLAFGQSAAQNLSQLAHSLGSGGVVPTTNGGTGLTTLTANDCLAVNSSATAIVLQACGGGGGSIILQTNGTNNTSQTTLNLQSGSGINVLNTSGGNVSVSTTQPYRTVTGTTDTLSCTTDANGAIKYNNAGSIAVAVPQATGTCGAGFGFTVQDYGAGTVTLTPTTSTVNGSSSLAIASGRGCSIVSDGTNYQVFACTALISGGGGDSILGVTSTLNVTGPVLTNLVTFSVSASTNYYVECYLTYSETAGATQIQFTGPASPTLVNYWQVNTGGSVKTAYGTLLGLSGQTTQFPANVIVFTLQNGSNAGTVAIQVQNSTTADIATVYAGSFCRVN